MLNRAVPQDRRHWEILQAGCYTPAPSVQVSLRRLRVKRRDLLTTLGATSLLGFPASTSARAPQAGRPFSGLTSGVGDLYRLSRARTRSISPENFTGAK